MYPLVPLFFNLNLRDNVSYFYTVYSSSTLENRRTLNTLVAKLKILLTGTPAYPCDRFTCLLAFRASR
ncbi:hypothetical protein PR048_008901, partial [Dryococelus australis]